MHASDSPPDQCKPSTNNFVKEAENPSTSCFVLVGNTWTPTGSECSYGSKGESSSGSDDGHHAISDEEEELSSHGEAWAGQVDSAADAEAITAAATQCDLSGGSQTVKGMKAVNEAHSLEGECEGHALHCLQSCIVICFSVLDERC